MSVFVQMSSLRRSRRERKNRFPSNADRMEAVRQQRQHKMLQNRLRRKKEKRKLEKECKNKLQLCTPDFCKAFLSWSKKLHVNEKLRYFELQEEFALQSRSGTGDDIISTVLLCNNICPEHLNHILDGEWVKNEEDAKKLKRAIDFETMLEGIGNELITKT